jgi:hypothetical protein
MRRSLALTLAFAASGVLVSGCASNRAAPMEPCGGRDFAQEIRPDILRAALVRAARWSDEVYGSDCVVCAEFYDDDEHSFTFHVTSPASEGMILNTSATLTFNRSSGRLLRTALYHSCHVRRVHQ